MLHEWQPLQRQKTALSNTANKEITDMLKKGSKENDCFVHLLKKEAQQHPTFQLPLLWLLFF